MAGKGLYRLGWAAVLACCSSAALADDMAVPAAAECHAPPEETAFLPTTGLAFTLPPAGDDQAGPCQDLPPPPVRPAPPNIFGMVALPVKSTSMNPLWDAARQVDPEALPASWREAAAQASVMSGERRLAFVNTWINNAITYVEDGSGDHWASAAETAQLGHGDCEDFAIAKLALLQLAGVSPGDLFLVIVRDTMRNRDHAVLAARLDGGMMVLDSRTDRLLPSGVITDYRPMFSFEGPFAWMHGYKASASPVSGG